MTHFVRLQAGGVGMREKKERNAHSKMYLEIICVRDERCRYIINNNH